MYTNKQGQNASTKKRIVKHQVSLKRVFISFTLATVGLVAYGYAYQYTHQAKLEKQYQQVQQEIEAKNKSLLQSSEQQKQLQEKLKQLETELQAKKAEKLRIASLPKAQVARAASVSVSGDKADLLRQAGVAEVHIASAIGLISRESGWRLTATNSIGCIGLGQACPSGIKSVLLSQCPDWQTNAVCQLRVFTNYANVRYGGWNQAKAFSDRNNWY